MDKLLLYSRRLNALLLCLFSITAICLLAACGEEPYRLDSQDKTIIDTTANNEIQRLIPILEDSCKRHFEENIQKMTDSIVEFQIKAIEDKLKQRR
jgi:hypothetical protein